MNQRKKNVLSFPAPLEEPAPSTMICQIGNQRFAIHWEIEELPPILSPLRVKRVAQKRTQRRRSLKRIEDARRRKGE